MRRPEIPRHKPQGYRLGGRQAKSPWNPLTPRPIGRVPGHAARSVGVAGHMRGGNALGGPTSWRRPVRQNCVDESVISVKTEESVVAAKMISPTIAISARMLSTMLIQAITFVAVFIERPSSRPPEAAMARLD